jgi:ParB/RepB/Spo0J family partition protein
MTREIELASLDLRYEDHRMKNAALEAHLLASIMERGIEQPLEGADSSSSILLLNGFKRYRCARKLGLARVPYLALGEAEVAAIVNLLRIANEHALSILEQAAFLDELRRQESMSVTEIAEQVGRSKAWVSMRLGLLAEMSPRVREKIFRGEFPVYAYMYTLRRFMRINKVAQSEIEDFVVAVSGRKSSVRDVEQLAQGYFRGPDSLREAIRSGHTASVLEWMRQVPEDPDGCNQFERSLLKDLEIAHKYMLRVMSKSQDRRLKTPAFYAQAHLLSAGILSRQHAFFERLRQLHDCSGQAQSRVSSPPGGHEPVPDCPAPAPQP